MKIYKLVYQHNEYGNCVDWHSSKRDAELQGSYERGKCPELQCEQSADLRLGYYANEKWNPEISKHMHSMPGQRINPDVNLMLNSTSKRTFTQPNSRVEHGRILGICNMLANR